jgi:hypothetical protein
MDDFASRLAAAAASDQGLHSQVLAVFAVFEATFERWPHRDVVLSFNGGKDCTVRDVAVRGAVPRVPVSPSWLRARRCGGTGTRGVPVHCARPAVCRVHALWRV